MATSAVRLAVLSLFLSVDALRIGIPAQGWASAHWSGVVEQASHGAAICLLSATLAICPVLPHAYAEGIVGVQAGPGAGVEAVRPALPGSPVAGEVWALLDKYFLDRSFNGIDFKSERLRLEALAPLTDEAALDESASLVRRLGDRYSRVLPPKQADKLGKYDVTGVGLNLIISDSGEDMSAGERAGQGPLGRQHSCCSDAPCPRSPFPQHLRSCAGKMLVGAVPNHGSSAERAGIAYGDEVRLAAFATEPPKHEPQRTLTAAVIAAASRRRLQQLPKLAPAEHWSRAQVLSINGKATSGMTSFDALEAIQSDPAAAVLTVKANLHAEGRTVRRWPRSQAHMRERSVAWHSRPPRLIGASGFTQASVHRSRESSQLEGGDPGRRRKRARGLGAGSARHGCCCRAAIATGRD